MKISMEEYGRRRIYVFGGIIFAAVLVLLFELIIAIVSMDHDSERLMHSKLRSTSYHIMEISHTYEDKLFLNANAAKEEYSTRDMVSEFAGELKESITTDFCILDRNGNILTASLGTAGNNSVAQEEAIVAKIRELMQEDVVFGQIYVKGVHYNIAVDTFPQDEKYVLAIVSERDMIRKNGNRMIVVQCLIGLLLVTITFSYLGIINQRSKKAEMAAVSEQNFLMNMSHSIRTPLNSMMGYVRLLQKNTTDPEITAHIDIIDNMVMQLSGSFGQLQKIEEIPVEKLDIYVKSGGEYRVKVLVVDDNEQNLFIMQELLKGYDLHVELAGSGMEAIGLLTREAKEHEANVYAVVFMDYMMPEMNGIETTRKIREICDGIYEELPIIALTANAVEGIAEQFKKEGMYLTMTKPIDLNILDEAMASYVPRRVISELKARRDSYSASGMDEAEKEKLIAGGIEVDAAMEHVGGDVQRYRKVLRLFCVSAKTRMKNLESFLADKNFAEYTILIHAIKGNAYTIGAGHLGDLAAEMEKLSKREQEEELLIRQKPFEEEFMRITEVAGRYLAGVKTEEINVVLKEGKISRKEYEEAKAEILEYLDNFDKKAATDKIRELLGYELTRAQKTILNECLSRIEEYDYDGAISALHNG